MTAKYPFEECWKERVLGRNQDDDDLLPEEIEENLTKTSTTNSSSKQPPKMKVTKSMKAKFTSQKLFMETDPDKYCLPFWVGTFVIISQLFIYTIVMGRLFQSRIPPNADPWLRMAQIFAVIVTLYTQSDFIDGIFFNSLKFSDDAFIT